MSCYPYMLTMRLRWIPPATFCVLRIYFHSGFSISPRPQQLFKKKYPYYNIFRTVTLVCGWMYVRTYGAMMACLPILLPIMNLHYQFHLFSLLDVELCACACATAVWRSGPHQMEESGLRLSPLSHELPCGGIPARATWDWLFGKNFADHDVEKTLCVAEWIVSIDWEGCVRGRKLVECDLNRWNLAGLLLLNELK